MFAGVERSDADVGLAEELGHPVIGLHAEKLDVGGIACDGTHRGKLWSAPDKLEAGLEAAVAEAIGRVLSLARVNPLLRAIVTATHGAETELVPLLTTRADGVIAVAGERVRDRLVAYPDVRRPAVNVTVDLLVRTVLSHVMQPSADADGVPGALATAVTRLLAD